MDGDDTSKEYDNDATQLMDGNYATLGYDSDAMRFMGGDDGMCAVKKKQKWVVRSTIMCYILLIKKIL
jgi:hypothetical protein